MGNYHSGKLLLALLVEGQQRSHFALTTFVSLSSVIVFSWTLSFIVAFFPRTDSKRMTESVAKGRMECVLSDV